MRMKSTIISWFKRTTNKQINNKGKKVTGWSSPSPTPITCKPRHLASRFPGPSESSGGWGLGGGGVDWHRRGLARGRTKGASTASVAPSRGRARGRLANPGGAKGDLNEGNTISLKGGLWLVGEEGGGSTFSTGIPFRPPSLPGVATLGSRILN